MSVAITNCGDVGWVSDRRGYRYTTVDPITDKVWPDMPANFIDIASRAADTSGFPNFIPDACLINRYDENSKLGSHQDKDEACFDSPIVSVSLGLSAIFQLYGATRGGTPTNILLEDGDVLVFGGPARLAFHGVRKIIPSESAPLLSQRINLTFRKAL